MKFSIIKPQPVLQPYVQYFWSAKFDGPPSESMSIRTFVDDSTGLIFQHGEGRSAIKKDEHFIPTGLVYGQITSPTENKCISGFSAIGVLFHPQSLHMLFGLDAYHLTDRVFDIDECVENENLTEAVINSKDVSEQVSIISNFLIDRISDAREEDVLVRACINRIKEQRGDITVRDLVQHVGLSERQLERRFLQSAGVSPRHYIQVARFNAVVDRLRRNHKGSLSDIAFDLNFCDHSHFSRTIKRLSGFNPKHLRNHLTRDTAINVIIKH